MTAAAGGRVPRRGLTGVVITRRTASTGQNFGRWEGHCSREEALDFICTRVRNIARLGRPTPSAKNCNLGAGITALKSAGMEDGRGRARHLPDAGTMSRAAGLERIVSGRSEGLGRCNAILSQILSRLSIIDLSWDLVMARASLPPSPAPPDAAGIQRSHFPNSRRNNRTMSHGPQVSHVGGYF